MLEFIHQNPWILLAAYWIFNAAVEAMPAPAQTASAGYSWAYKFLNTIAGNVQEAFAKKLPGSNGTH